MPLQAEQQLREVAANRAPQRLLPRPGVRKGSPLLKGGRAKAAAGSDVHGCTPSEAQAWERKDQPCAQNWARLCWPQWPGSHVTSDQGRKWWQQAGSETGQEAVWGQNSFLSRDPRTQNSKKRFQKPYAEGSRQHSHYWGDVFAPREIRTTVLQGKEL